MNKKIIELLEDERAVHGGRFFEAGYYMALDHILDSDIPYIKNEGAPIWDKEKWLMDTLVARKEKLKKEHVRLQKKNGAHVGEVVAPITGAYETNRPHKFVMTVDLGAESFVAGQLAGVEKAMEIVKEFVQAERVWEVNE